jgi:hypothetical protein
VEGADVRIVVDRDSVAMGDDVDPHLEVWDVDEGTRIGDIVERIATSPSFLAHVHGEVAWRIEAIHGAELLPGEGPGGIAGMDRDSGCAHDVALLMVPRRGQPLISHMSNWKLQAESPASEVRPTPTGERVFYARYLSGGYPVELADYRQITRVGRWAWKNGDRQDWGR